MSFQYVDSQAKIFSWLFSQFFSLAYESLNSAACRKITLGTLMLMHTEEVPGLLMRLLDTFCFVPTNLQPLRTFSSQLTTFIISSQFFQIFILYPFFLIYQAAPRQVECMGMLQFTPAIGQKISNKNVIAQISTLFYLN